MGRGPGSPEPYDSYIALDEEGAMWEDDTSAGERYFRRLAQHDQADPSETPAETALSGTLAVGQEEASAEAQPAARAGSRHARRRAMQLGRLPPAAETAAAAVRLCKLPRRG